MATYLPINLIILSCISIPILAFILSIFYSYEYRKIIARLQGRRGPYFIVPKEVRSILGMTRLWQPLFDILKLLFKETIVPSPSNKLIFKTAPYVALISLVGIIFFVPIVGISPFGKFEFSLIIILYLLLVMPLSLIIGGSASSSPWGAYGAQREVELFLAYEVPQVLGIFALAITADTLSISNLIAFQIQKIPFIILNPFAAIVVFISFLGKFKVKPFDITEAEVEIVAGTLTEYSGKLLGIIEIVRSLFVFLIPTLFVDLFLGGGIVGTYKNPNYPFSIIVFIIESLMIIFIFAFIHVYNPRFRIDQAFNWFLKYPLVLGFIAIIWAYAIRYFGIL